MLARKMLLSTVASAGLALALAAPISITLSVTTPAVAETGPNVKVGIEIFEDRLARYGDWVEHEGGNVWVPTQVDARWQPYTKGRWAFVKTYGWTWVSDDDWGWATDHYGRWGYKEDIGWYWVPGTVWAPAWVSWRRSSKHVAWAPLPPKDHRVYVHAEVDVEPEAIPVMYWRVAPVTVFAADEVSTEIVVGDEAETLIRETKPVGAVRVRKNIVVNDVIEPEFVETQAGVKVVVHEPRPARSVEDAERVSEREIAIFNASVDPSTTENWKPKQVKTPDEVRASRRKTSGGADAASTSKPTEPKMEDAGPTGATGTAKEGTQTGSETSATGEATGGAGEETTRKPTGNGASAKVAPEEEEMKTKAGTETGEQSIEKGKKRKTAPAADSDRESSTKEAVTEPETDQGAGVRKKTSATETGETQPSDKASKRKKSSAGADEQEPSANQAKSEPEGGQKSGDQKRKKASEKAEKTTESSEATGAVSDDSSGKKQKPAGEDKKSSKTKPPEEAAPQQ